MEFTQCFLHTRTRPDRASIKLKWIESVVKNPEREEIQSDGRIRKWGYIEEEGKYLRVILLDDQKTIHNAFFDRRLKEKK